MFQLDALLGMDVLVVAVLGLATTRQFPTPGRRMAGSVGVGAMIGLGSIFYFLALTRLPLSETVGAANAYVIVTVLLSVFAGHAGLPWTKRLAIVLTAAGVTLFTLSRR